MKILFLFLLSIFILYGDDNNLTQKQIIENNIKKEYLKQEEIKASKINNIKIEKYLIELELIEQEILQEKVWMKSYSSYLTSLEVRNSLKKIRNKIAFLKQQGNYLVDKDSLSSLVSKERILATQVNRLDEKGSALFSKLLTPPIIEKVPEITNPFDVFTGISLIKTFNSNLQDYLQRKEKITTLISLIRKEKDIYTLILKLEDDKRYIQKLKDKTKQLERFEIALDTIAVTAEVYQKRLESFEANIQRDIKKQIYRLIDIAIIIFVIILIFFLLKLVVKKYITDNDRFYMANKIINFTNITLIMIILLFNYMENVSHLVTILGFASAGIAIAMKDWFMSILGWLVIVFGGSVHVGDRIRVDMDGMHYVGDVMDISLLRITLLEDITYTTYVKNRRAGRIIFIPNNYVFTRMIANYSHSSLKTVWDGIDITITYESNHKKAMHICKEITKKYSKGYTDITRKQLNKIRSHYSLKNTNVEPRIFSFIEPYGLVISAWYLTNAYGTLTLRSSISMEIIDAFNKEDDIEIAYPTQKIHVDDGLRVKPSFTEHEVV